MAWFVARMLGAALRQEKSVAIVACVFDLWEAELGKASGKSKTAEAIRCALTPAGGAGTLSGGWPPSKSTPTSSSVQLVRLQTIARTNSLFAGSHGGGRTWATVEREQRRQEVLVPRSHSRAWADRIWRPVGTR
jgi:hypothetical protein